jgi:phosphoribosylanthranilate isomerase
MLMRTRVKFCGITRLEDAQRAVNVGVDALGFIFAARSPRRVAIEQARELAAVVPPFVARVALFLDHSADEVATVLNRVSIDAVQFHGREEAAFCRLFGKPYLKVVPMMDVTDVTAFAQAFPDCSGFVLDSHRAGADGGSGETFDWTRVPRESRKPLILAGGLNPGNVAEAVRRAAPYAVDVASGIESSPGLKDHAKMQAFIDEVRRAGGH